jgi:hypothetical protein
MEDKITSKLSWFHISSRNLGELEDILDPFYIQRPDLGTFIKYIVVDLLRLKLLMERLKLFVLTNNCWLRHIWQHQWLLDFPLMEDKITSKLSWFRISSHNLGELEDILDLFDIQRTDLGTFIGCIVLGLLTKLKKLAFTIF